MTLAIQQLLSMLQRLRSRQRHRPCPMLGTYALWMLLGSCTAGADGAARPDLVRGSGRLVIDTVPLLAVGASDESGGVRLSKVVAATRATDGGIAVADAAELRIGLFAASGQLLRFIGRSGGGPGEFRSLLGLWRCAGDSLFAWDPALNRMTVFSPDGGYAREIRFPGRPGPMACSRDGRIAVLMTPPGVRMPDASGASAIFRTSMELFDGSGRRIGIVSGLQAFDNRPGGVRTRIAASEDGVIIGSQQAPVVEVYDWTGARVGTRPAGVGGRPFTSELYEARIHEMFAGIQASPQRDSLVAYMLRIPRPEELPAYEELLVGGRRMLWADVSTPGRTSAEFVVSDSSGTELGRVRMAGKFRAFEAGEDYLLGAVEDADGLEEVVVFRVSAN